MREIIVLLVLLLASPLFAQVQGGGGGGGSGGGDLTAVQATSPIQVTNGTGPIPTVACSTCETTTGAQTKVDTHVNDASAAHAASAIAVTPFSTIAATTVQAALEELLSEAGGAPTDARYWTARAESGLSAEVNLGALTTGLLKHTVSGAVSTPATAIADTDYQVPLTFGVGVARSSNAISLDLSTLVGNQTFFDGSQATRTITFNLSGTDPVITVGSSLINISTGALQVGGLDVLNASSIGAGTLNNARLSANLSQIGGLADPNADRILFWDDSASSYSLLTVGSGLSISGTNLTATANSAVGGSNAVQGSDGAGTFTDTGCTAVSAVMTCTGGFVSGDGTAAGVLKMLELTASGSNFRQWTVVDTLTADLTMKLGDVVPTAGQVMRFGAPSSNISAVTFGDASGVGACTNQAVTTLNNNAAPTCSSIVNAMITNATIDLTTKVTGLLPGVNIASNAISSARLAVVNTRKTCTMVTGADNGSALADADLAQGRQCFIAQPSTVVEVTVAGDAGTPNVIPGRNVAGSVANLVSSALATAASGGLACSKTTAVTGIDGATTCASTLQNTALAAGSWISLVSGTAGGTAKRMSVAVTYLVD